MVLRITVSDKIVRWLVLRNLVHSLYCVLVTLLIASLTYGGEVSIAMWARKSGKTVQHFLNITVRIFYFLFNNLFPLCG